MSRHLIGWMASICESLSQFVCACRGVYPKVEYLKVWIRTGCDNCSHGENKINGRIVWNIHPETQILSVWWDQRKPKSRQHL